MFTDAEGQWIFSHELGRFADEETLASHIKYTKEPDQLRKLLYSSKERTSSGIARPQPGTFTFYKKETPKLLILGNCQAANIARQIAAAANISVIGLEVMAYDNNKSFFHEAIASADMIASCLLSPRFGEISTVEMRKNTSPPIRFYCPIFFEGIHPDIVYWGGMGERSQSAVGDYHSRIVLKSFLDGRSEKDCLSDLNETNYEALGYFDRYELSLDELRRRENGCDIKIAELLESQITSKNMFITVNHPTQYALHIMAKLICKSFDVPCIDIDPYSVQSALVMGPVWPIVPEIIERFGLQYQNGNLFSVNGHSFDWEEYIMRTYSIYTAVGKEKLSTMGSDDQVNILYRTRA